MRIRIKMLLLLFTLIIKANANPSTIILQTEQKYVIGDSINSIYELEIINVTSDTVLWLWVAPNLNVNGDINTLIKQFFFDKNTRLFNIAVDINNSVITPTIGVSFITRIYPQCKFSFLSKERNKIDNIIPYVVILSQDEIILRYPKLNTIIDPPIIFYDKTWLIL